MNFQKNSSIAHSYRFIQRSYIFRSFLFFLSFCKTVKMPLRIQSLWDRESTLFSLFPDVGNNFAVFFYFILKYVKAAVPLKMELSAGSGELKSINVLVSPCRFLGIALGALPAVLTFSCQVLEKSIDAGRYAS